MWADAPEEKASEKGSSDAEAVAVPLGVADVLGVCVSVTADERVSVCDDVGAMLSELLGDWVALLDCDGESLCTWDELEDCDGVLLRDCVALADGACVSEGVRVTDLVAD